MVLSVQNLTYYFGVRVLPVKPYCTAGTSRVQCNAIKDLLLFSSLTEQEHQLVCSPLRYWQFIARAQPVSEVQTASEPNFLLLTVFVSVSASPAFQLFS